MLWFGAHRVDAGAMQIGQLTAFLSYIAYILMAVMMSTMMFVMVPRAVVSSERIGEVLGHRDLRGPVADRPSALPGATAPGPARAARASSSATRAPSGRSCTASTWWPSRAGRPRSSARPGPGKTTLLNLIPRLFDVTGGSVLLDGVDVRDARPGPAVDADRARPAEAVPVRRHRAVQPRVRQAGRDRRGAVARARGRAGTGLRRGARPRGSTRRSRRAAPTCPAASDNGSPSPGRSCVRRPNVYLFDDSFSALDYATDARAARGAGPRDPGGDRAGRRAARGHHPARRLASS